MTTIHITTTAPDGTKSVTSMTIEGMVEIHVTGRAQVKINPEAFYPFCERNCEPQLCDCMDYDYTNQADFCVGCGEPESFCRCDDDIVWTCPISCEKYFNCSPQDADSCQRKYYDPE